MARAKHAGVEGAFHQFFIRQARIEMEYGKLYTLLRRTREDSDYNDRATATEEAARQRLADSRRFVARLEQYLRDAGLPV